MFCSHYDMLEKSLVKRGFIVHQAKDVNEAKQLAFSLIKPNESVGFGGKGGQEPCGRRWGEKGRAAAWESA